ncbi:hypothetical protein Zmor_012778 [Zophobas morio]|uniref:Uncharacterized protein n=1 Tax=Zophobas morio TaxID=2755281 RepID=A0AA38IG28_9CUCU|nr:hypothetical protein Zmor_012778 [Zophobas morio]
MNIIGQEFLIYRFDLDKVIRTSATIYVVKLVKNEMNVLVAIFITLQPVFATQDPSKVSAQEIWSEFKKNILLAGLVIASISAAIIFGTLMVCLYKYIQSKQTPRSDDSNQEVASNDSNQERVSYDSRSGSVDLQFNQNM